MKAKTIISIVVSFITMFLLPWLTVSYAIGNDALGLLLIFLVVLNPLVSVGVGIAGGWGKKAEWHLVLINAIIYLISAIVITGFDFTYILATVLYFAIGLAATYITAKIRNKK